MLPKVARGPAYVGGCLDGPAVADYTFHLRLDVGTRNSANGHTWFQLQANRPDGHSTVIRAGDLESLDRLADLLLPGARRALGTWQTETDLSPGNEVRHSRLLADVVMKSQYPLNRHRTIIESYLHYRTCPDQDREITRRHARVSVVAGDRATPANWRGKSSVLSKAGLVGVGPSDLERAIDEAFSMERNYAQRSPTGGYDGPVVLSPQAAGVLLHEAVGHLAEADNYLKSADPMYGVNERLASLPLTVRDKGNRVGEWGSVEVDDECWPTREVELMREGVLTALLTDKRHAALSDGTSTGHGRVTRPDKPVSPRLARIMLEPGEADVAELRGAAGRHLYVERVGMGSLNPRTRQVDISLQGTQLTHDNGEVELRVGGHCTLRVDEFLARVCALANEVAWTPSICSKQGQALPVESAAPALLLSALPVRPDPSC